MWVRACECKCLQSKEAFDRVGTGVLSSHELPYVGTGNRTGVLWKSNTLLTAEPSLLPLSLMS